MDGFHGPAGKSGSLPFKQGYFLADIDIEDVDSRVFPMSKKELEWLDPNQRQLLQVAYECFEDAGTTSWRGRNIGCYIGAFGEDWSDQLNKETQKKIGPHGIARYDFAISNRLSYEFNLCGPSMTIKTACSSSLIALDLACHALREGMTEAALVGGVNLIFSSMTWQILQNLGVLSPSGQCKSFDASADGYGRGEAVNMIYIKPLADAIRDNDPIRAVIRGTASNADGHTQGFTSPSSTAQASLIQKAYQDAGICDLSETAMCECHGTGTQAGDPIETEAVAQSFGEKGIILTAVKPNVGHSEGAAGITSVIKCVLALEHRVIPPNINFRTPNPKIPFKQYKLHVPMDVEEWPKDRAKRISINSFGIGGANAHAIIESLEQTLKEGKHVRHQANHNPVEPDTSNLPTIQCESNVICSEGSGSPRPTNTPCTETSGISDGSLANSEPEHLLLFSAYSNTSLGKYLSVYETFMRSNRHKLRDLAYTLAHKREQKPFRAFVVTNSRLEFESSPIIHFTSSAIRKIWVFTGQGAQWPRMAVGLIEHNPVFRSTIRKLDNFLRTLPLDIGFSIEDELRRPEATSRVLSIELGHPLTTAIQIALVDVLRTWNLEPDVVLGHSSGEIAAAYAAGALTAESAIVCAACRGRADMSSKIEGSMAAIGLGRQEMLEYLVPGVTIACDNTHSSVTISGDSQAVHRVLEQVSSKRPGTFCRLLPIKAAYHSPIMAKRGAQYELELMPLFSQTKPKVAMYSTVTGKLVTEPNELGVAYWRQNMESPVLFNCALRAALSASSEKTSVLEVGPHSTLRSYIRQIIDDMSLMSKLAGCFNMVFPSTTWKYALQGLLSDTPLYQWQNETTHWAEPRVAREWRFREYPHHELLGSRVVEVSSLEPCWRNALLQDVEWLKGHEINNQILFPAAGYISMVGEAIRQLEEAHTYSLRDVRFLSALVVDSEQSLELMTSLRQLKVDSNEQSSWYSFTISSYNGSKWVRNVTGEARALIDKASSFTPCPITISPFHRSVDNNAWYDVLSRIGFRYTGLFRRMRSVSACTTSNEAHAIVPIEDTLSEEYRSLHPAVIDACFHLLTIAGARGLERRMVEVALPTSIEEIIVSSGQAELNVWATSQNSMDGMTSLGSLNADSSGSAILQVRGLQSSTITRHGQQRTTHMVLSRIEWQPHSKHTDISLYLQPLTTSPVELHLVEEMSLLGCMHVLETVQATQHTPEYLRKYLAWMQSFVDSYKSGRNALVSNNAKLDSLDPDRRLARLIDLEARISATSMAAISMAIARLVRAASDIYSNKVQGLEILREDQLLTDIYNLFSLPTAPDMLQVLGNTNPRLRILEVGAGTGATTATVLSGLKSAYGERLYQSYKFTDVSPTFLAPAKLRFAKYEQIEYAVFDITKDPVSQGLELGSFDLIVASNVVHATPYLSTTLKLLYDLLSWDGRLYLVEISPETSSFNFIMGVLPGWWHGSEDGRPSQPYVSIERWRKELELVGFQPPEVAILDNQFPYQVQAHIVASKIKLPTEASNISILCHDPRVQYVLELGASLSQSGIGTSYCRFGEPLPDNDIVSLVDFPSPKIHDMDSYQFEKLMTYLKQLKGTMLWIIQPTQTSCADPNSGVILGLARTARAELGIKLFTFEMDRETSPGAASKAVQKLICAIRGRDCSVMDYEYAVVNGEIMIPRIHWQTMEKAIAFNDGEEIAFTTKKLEIGKSHTLQSLGWNEYALPEPRPGEVMVKVKAAGLNFRDLMITLGLLKNTQGKIGFEGSGVVQAVGAGVQDLSIGDEVVYIHQECMSTYKNLPAISCAKFNGSMSFEQAAAAPICHATALIALFDKVNLQKGQSVLIHSACGGVGLAAIQLAQMTGANIYCTVGSEEKVQFLEDEYGIDRSHIFHSRDASFLPGILRVTNGQGVDVVLNSLSGELLRASWLCVAESGTMVEIGKRDIQRHARLDMSPFDGNRTFVGLDLSKLNGCDPQRITSSIQRCVDLIQSGTIPGPLIAKAVPARYAVDAFRTMQAARHIGKIVIRMPDDSSNLESVKSMPSVRFHHDKSYLLVGGLGGLGRVTATWMVENGARHLIFLSRSGCQDEETQQFIDELRSQDCQVQIVSGSVANMDDVQQAVKGALAPIAGIFQMSLVLKDISLSNMTFSDWKTPLDCKIKGTWNLHHATLSCDLDFFVLYSSITGYFGNPGQANYAAANTFLDAFAQYRHHQRLAASVIDIGVIAGAGYVSQRPELLKNLESNGARLVRVSELLDVVTLAIQQGRVRHCKEDRRRAHSPYNHFILGANTSHLGSKADNLPLRNSDRRMSIHYNLKHSEDRPEISTAGQKSLRNILSSASQSDSNKRLILVEAIAEVIEDCLNQKRKSMPLDRPLSNFGIDSLVAIDIRHWIKHHANVDVSPVTIIQAKSISHLADIIWEGMTSK